MSAALPDYLALINDVLQAIIVIFGFAVVLYNLPHVRRERVTRAFSALITFVIIVYLTELLVSRTIIRESAEQWLKMGWIGISMVPAALFHLSDALLVTTGDHSPRRRLLVRLGYLGSLIFLLLAVFSDSIVSTLVALPRAPHLLPGPFFPLFAVYFWPIVTAASIYNVLRARKRCLTPTSRRRMNIIVGAFIAAPLAVFPYFLLSRSVSSNVNLEIPLIFWFILIVGNLLVAILFALLTNNLAYFGALSLDRVVRVRLYKYMARVPLTASIMLLVFVWVNRSTSFWGLPTDAALALTLVGTVILVEWVIHLLKLPLERLFQLDNDPDVRRIQLLSERLLTTRDLHQFLESILASLCNSLRTPAAFITALTTDGPQLEAIVGQLAKESNELWEDASFVKLTMPGETISPDSQQFILWQNYWLRPLYDRSNKTMLGILGMERRAPEPNLTEQEQLIFNDLLLKASAALEDRLLQQDVFAAVEGLLPQITALQEWRQAISYGQTAGVEGPQGFAANEEILSDPNFTSMVKDALSHYWGGPKLTESPLHELGVVQTAVDENDGSSIKALRAILNRAIALQKPDGEQRLNPDWILYNILELKFIEGARVRDIARRLALSESDLYRKQRIAIENVSRTIQEMEQPKADTSAEHPPAIE